MPCRLGQVALVALRMQLEPRVVPEDRSAPRRQTAITRDRTRDNVDSYLWSEMGIFPAEARIFSQLDLRDERVLDLGCGNGRITRWLLENGAEVCASDLAWSAVEALGSRVKLGSARVVQADARALPFLSRSFGLVVFGFNGLDFLDPVEDRRVALTEIDRVLKDGGYFVFSSHNPVGTVFSPRAVRSAGHLLWRAGYVTSGGLRKRYSTHPGGLTLHQATPRTVIAEVEDTTILKFVLATNRQGNIRSLRLLHLFSAWPYFVFRKTESIDRLTKETQR